MTRGKTSANLISNVGFFVLNILVNLWLTSFLIRQIGVAMYGMVPLAVTVTSYLNVITVGLNVAVGRHMTLALENGDDARVSRIFNSALLASAAASVFILIVGWLGALKIPDWINVPAGRESEVQGLFLATVATLSITTFSSTFSVVSYCKNRFDLQNIGNIIGLMIRVAVLLALFAGWYPSLWHIGISLVASAMASLLFAIVAYKRLMPLLAIRVSDFSFSILREISSTGIWIFVSQIGTLLIVSVDLVVANKILGAEAAGKYASALQLPTVVRNLAMVVSAVFGPTVIYFYAQNKIDDLVQYVNRSTRYIGLFLALPVGLICGFSRPLLSTWLGPSVAEMAGVMIVLTFHLSMNLSYLTLHHIGMATNKVKIPGLSQIFSGALNLVLAIYLGKIYGVYGIAAAGAVVLLLRNIIFTPIYTAYILNKPLRCFLFSAIPSVLLTLAITLLGWLVTRYFYIDGWYRLAAAGSVVSLAYILISWFLFIDSDERAQAAVQIKIIYSRVVSRK